MRTLTPSEKRTIRLGLIGISLYLALFGGGRILKGLRGERTAYQEVVRKGEALKQDVKVYQDKALVLETLMYNFRMDPASLSRSNLVADASAAIQKLAAGGGMQFGPIRESAGRAAGKELATMQLEGAGPVPAVMAFLHNVTTLGYPVIIDSVQLTADPSKPGAIKVSLSLVILDFKQWKKAEARNV